MTTCESINVDEPLSTLVEAIPDFESLLEDLGIDYWFGWRTSLRAVCAYDGVDLAKAEEAITRAAALAPAPPAATAPVRSVSSILSELKQHYTIRIQPALRRLATECETMKRRGHELVRGGKHIEWISRDLAAHMEKVDEILVPYVIALEQGRTVTSDPRITRDFALAHTDLAFHVRELQDAVAAATSWREEAFRRAFRDAAREVHHHIRIGYNEVLPRIADLARSRNRAPHLTS
jgi:iron-sulfur cluster repair protein YtfE (RIC family)